MKHTCQLWKVLLSSTLPNDSVEDMTFWAFHMNEAQARDAALRWGEQQAGPAAVVSITRVDVVS
jgi:hypothetical protein